MTKKGTIQLFDSKNTCTEIDANPRWGWNSAKKLSHKYHHTVFIDGDGEWVKYENGEATEFTAKYL